MGLPSESLKVDSRVSAPMSLANLAKLWEDGEGRHAFRTSDAKLKFSFCGQEVLQCLMQKHSAV